MLIVVLIVIVVLILIHNILAIFDVHFEALFKFSNIPILFYLL